MIWKTKESDYFAAHCFEGMERAYPERWKRLHTTPNSSSLIALDPPEDRPALLISGGAGNGPLFPSYVGLGLADAAVLGAPFAAPNAYAIYEAGKAIGAKGVLLLYNNFAGDFLNNEMASELLAMDGIPVRSIMVNDDVATALGEDKANRSGRAGVILLIKMAAEALQEGWSLDATAALLERALEKLLTISMTVDFEAGVVVYGSGFSGEPGIFSSGVATREKACQEAMDILLDELQVDADEQLFCLLNRLRLTSYADGYIMAKHAYDYLSATHQVAAMRVGNFTNIADVYGFTFTLLAMDPEMQRLMQGLRTSDCTSF